MTQDKGKNIFQSAIDAVSNRDEKAALEAAAKHAQEVEARAEAAEQKLAASEAKVAQLTAELTKTKADLDTARANVTTQLQKLSSVQGALAATNVELQKYVSAEQAKAIQAAADAAAAAQVMTEHTIKADETLSHLSLKYYGSAYEPYWRVIYEANKDVIGPNPSHVRPGTVLKIPVLPEELKKK